MSDVVSKKTVDEIVQEISRIDIHKIELDDEAQEFLARVEAYLNCLEEHQALYEEIDPSHQLANYDMPDVREAIQQVSKSGKPVKNLVELYEVAEAMLPVFEAKINGLVEQLASSSDGSVKFKLPPGENNFKGMQRAWEKAQDDYSKKMPDGPAVSWLYDIVRGSVLFDTAEQLFQFLEILRADESIVIVKSKNRFCNPTLSGYRDFNMQIQITNDEDGSKHICELQLHITAIKEADTRLGSHAYYEFFRKYYAGAMDSLEARMDDLRAICKGGSLDMAFLANVVKNPLDVDHMIRLADLFEDYMNEYQLAIVITNAAMEIMELHDWYTRLGILFRCQGKLDEALMLHQASLDIRVEALGSEHTDVADSYNNMAVVLWNQGKLEEAMELYQTALGIQVKALGPNHTKVADSYNNMALVHWKQGEPEKATGLYKKALDIRVKAFGSEHTNVADSYTGMAIVLADQGKLEEAMEMYEKALDIRVKALGQEHTKVAGSYYNMALVLQNQGKLEEAMELYKKAVDIQVKALGQEHRDVADSYYNMALVLRDQGKLEEAMELHKKALDIQVKTLGLEHTKVADSNCNMAVVLWNQGKLEEALELYEKALDIRVNAFGANHTKVAELYNEIGYALCQQDRFEEALENCQKALNIQVKTLGENHLDTAYTLHSVGEILCKQDNKLEEAAQYGEKALNVFLELLGPDHPHTAEGRKLMDMIHEKEKAAVL